MAGLNLDAIAKFAESMMVDSCRIMRQESGADPISANWNETTGTYVPDRVDIIELYRGKCMVYTKTPSTTEQEIGGGPVAEESFFLSIPRQQESWQNAYPEDLVLITESQDQRLEGSMFKVETIDEGTHLASRELKMCRYVDMVA